MKSIVILAAALALPASGQALRDPFARPATAAALAAAQAPADVAVPPRLRAIMYEPGKSLVNINGRILAVGDLFDDYRVTAISANSATLTRRGSQRVIVLDEESSK